MIIKNIDKPSKTFLHRLVLELSEPDLAVADPYNAVKNHIRVCNGNICIANHAIDVMEEHMSQDLKNLEKNSHGFKRYTWR